MWLLVSASNNDVRFPILGDHKYVVGRQSCDIVIPDASVSRKQAILTMAHYETGVVKSYITPTLTLEDVSKFGTFVNGKAVKNPGGNTITLRHNDEIRFGGTSASIYKAVYELFVATTSCLEKAPKKSLIKVMCLLGGHLVRDWRPICDLLIMSKINVTIKVICAINNQKHIVTPLYLDDLLSHLMGKRETPDPASYLPEVVDQEVPAGVSFHPDIRRITLLQGLKFYFLSAVQFNKTNLAVSTAGGQPILLEDGTEEEAEAMTEDKTVVVAVSREILATLSPSCQKFVKIVISVLKRKTLRMVTDPEIGWAILTCNTVDFCNARSSITPDMLSYMASQSISQSTEMDTSHNVRSVDVKPRKRSLTDVQSQNTSAMEDVKPVVKIIKPEVFSPFSSKQILKTEPLEKDLEVKQAETTLRASEGSQSKEKQSNNFSILPALGISLSAIATPALMQPGENSVKHGKKTLDSHPRASQRGDTSVSRTDNDAEKNQKKLNEDDNPEETVSVFARRHGKFRAKPTVNNLNDPDDDLPIDNNLQASKRKTVDLFGDDDDEVGLTKRRKTDQLVERSKKKRDADSDMFVLSSEIMNDDLSGTADTAIQDDSVDLDYVTEGQSKREQDQGRQSTDISGGLSQETLHVPVLSADGWLNMETAKSKLSHDPDAAQNGDVGKDVKSDMELLRDDEGKLLRNLCQVQVADLISRPAVSKVKSAAAAKSNVQGEKNFKKFKKTQHVGAGRLPVIIGGRDLEVYLGSKHKDIEDLFSTGLAQENKRQENEQRERDLFDWDDRTRKASTKRIR